MNEQLKIPSVTGIDLELKIAGPGGRSYAFIIDWHIRLLLAIAWFVVASLLYQGTLRLVDLDETGTAGQVFTIYVPTAVIYFLYHPVLEILMRGRTPGKRMAGVRIVTTEGSVPGIGALLIRNILRLIDSLPTAYAVGLATTVLTRHSVRIGDLAAGTLLVYDEAEKGDPVTDLNSGAIARLGLGQAELVRDLVDRWAHLDNPIREALAVQLLTKLGQTGAANMTGDELINQLRRQLD